MATHRACLEHEQAYRPSFTYTLYSENIGIRKVSLNLNFEFIKIRHRSRLQVTRVETGLKSQLLSTPRLSYQVSMYNVIKMPK